MHNCGAETVLITFEYSVVKMYGCFIFLEKYEVATWWQPEMIGMISDESL